MSGQHVSTVHQLGSECPEFQVREGIGFWSREQLRNWVLCGEDVLLVAVEGDKILGFVLTALHQATGKVTWENLYVLPEFRGTGVGDMLIQEMIVRLRSNGAKHVCFMVLATNVREKVAEYYKKHGFFEGYKFISFDMPVSKLPL